MCGGRGLERYWAKLVNYSINGEDILVLYATRKTAEQMTCKCKESCWKGDLLQI